jgi:hypothetical protein
VLKDLIYLAQQPDLIGFYDEIDYLSYYEMLNIKGILAAQK